MKIDKKNIFLTNTSETIAYTSTSSGFGTTRFPTRSNAYEHSKTILGKIQRCKEDDTVAKQAVAIHHKEGMYLEFSGLQNFDLKVKSLEDIRQGIRLLKVWSEDEVERALVYVPSGKESYFIRKIEKYGAELTSKGNPKNNDLVRAIEDVKLATVKSFWVGKYIDMPEDNPCECEIWFRYDDKENLLENVCESIRETCEQKNTPFSEKYIVFPERVVFLVTANLEQLGIIIEGCDYVAEIRRAPVLVSFFESLQKDEQADWIEDLLSRTNFLESDVSVCLLDTGLNKDHPLICPFTSEERVDTIEAEWGIDDKQNHGTGMASIALFDNLEECLANYNPISISHWIESVKILPDRGENPPELYGAVTKQAIAQAEIVHPEIRRTICMAITSRIYNTEDGSPTSWSGAVDALAAGVDNNRERRLFFISAGNIECDEFRHAEYPNANKLHGVENPGQAWNAITVGGYSAKVNIADAGFMGFSPISDANDLSPYSSTSLMWDKKWPIKPEILLESGNMATNGDDISNCPDLSLLSANSNCKNRFFWSVAGTSPATAKASRMAAVLMQEYPSIWPETVRALLVHSAEWTDEMQRQFNDDDNKTGGRKTLLRCCGYGIPNLERAIQCYDNSVNLIIQGELQPYQKVGSKGITKDMDLHTLPWPKDVLLALGETAVKLKITLSYFIEPGPGEIGWKDKYRYPSCGLRFDIINTNETEDDFKKRINKKARGDDEKDKGEGTSGSDRWYLGSKNRDVGSIHSDFMIASAADLCEINHIAVYPVIGWWRERSYLGKCNSKIRYALVVSLSTPQEKVDLYTPIINQIKVPVETDIQTG